MLSFKPLSFWRRWWWWPWRRRQHDDTRQCQMAPKWSEGKNKTRKQQEQKKIRIEMNCVRCHPHCVGIVWLVCWVLDVWYYWNSCVRKPSDFQIILAFVPPNASVGSGDTRRGMYEWHLLLQLQKITSNYLNCRICSGRWNKKELFELLKGKSQLKCSQLSSLNASNWIPHQMVQILLYLIQCLITYNEW